MTAKDKKAPSKEAAKNKRGKVGKTKKESEGVSASVAKYVGYQLSMLDRGLCVASSSWPSMKK